MNINSIFNKEPLQVVEYLEQEFNVKVPEQIVTTQDMEEASKLLLKLSGYYSYMCTLLSQAKLLTREYKRTREKREYEDMVDRKDAIQNKCDAIKQEYAAISRAVTIKIENNRELNMGASG